jgi:DNA replication protein DnaC
MATNDFKKPADILKPVLEGIATAQPELSAYDAKEQEYMAEIKTQRQQAIIETVGSYYAEVMSFETLKIHNGNTAAVAKANTYISSPRGLYLYGTVGSGKTHIAVATLKEVVKQSTSVRWIVFDDLVQLLKSNFEHNDEDEVIMKFCQCKYLFIDDLGAGRNTEYAADVLQRIIRRRLSNGMHKVFITSNLTLAELSEKIDDRIASRVVELCGGMGNVVQIIGDDERVKTQ